MAEVIGPDLNQPLKPSRRAFLKAMGAITGAALLPSIASAELPFVPAVALPPVLPPLPVLEPLLAPVTGIRGLAVFLNGMMLQEGYDYVQAGESTVKFFTAPMPGDMISVAMPDRSIGCRKMADGLSSVIDLPLQ